MVYLVIPPLDGRDESQCFFALSLNENLGIWAYKSCFQLRSEGGGRIAEGADLPGGNKEGCGKIAVRPRAPIIHDTSLNAL